MLKLFTDAACTTEVGASISIVAYSDHSEGDQDFAFYLADLDADPVDTGGFEVVDQTNPGVDNIILSPLDSTPGSGQQASELKLASTALGLDSAGAGASLSMGNSIMAGVSGALPVLVRFTNARVTVGVAADLSIQVSAVTARAKP